MKKVLGLLGTLIIVSVLMVWLLPPKVVLYNEGDGNLTIKNEEVIKTLSKSIENAKKDGERIKTPFTNKLVIYKGIMPIKIIKFGMPSMFIDDRVGQVIIWGKPHKVDGSFYDVLYEIQERQSFSLDTL